MLMLFDADQTPPRVPAPRMATGRAAVFVGRVKVMSLFFRFNGGCASPARRRPWG